jgi:N-methylhydantoinase A/oxoprolinase/acetone carboxylase beta subunit
VQNSGNKKVGAKTAVSDLQFSPRLRRKPLKNKKPFVIACAVLALDIKYTAEKLGMDIGVKFLEGGLHDRPNVLREKLQEAVDEISASGLCDRIVIGYGVCGRGSVGLQTRDISIVIPKVHDCIALFLGGDAAYRREFKKYPGTYYISAGWYEEKTEPLSQRKRSAYYGDEKLNYDELVEKYGESAAKDTFQFLSTWQKNYQRAAFIKTGAKTSPKYEKYAREMAEEYGWKYEKILGDQSLIQKLLTAGETTDEILVVPPNHVVDFDALRSTLAANPIWDGGARRPEKSGITVLKDDGSYRKEIGYLKLGLGIDAGGTYTDTVIYDLGREKTICKSKALTTKWDFTVGIHEALSQLHQEKLKQVEMVSLSTTLATNAIVEGEGQKVGMVIMPAYGRLDPDEIPYEPKAVISGKLEITGIEISPVDEMEVRRVVRRMVEKDEVKAFAVSGYAGSINPAHELKVKRIIREESDLFVTCGHELSGILNFKTRAYTAMWNARIIPNLAKLLLDLEKELRKMGILAPIVVVKGDGTLMSAKMAKERPVETILSGPAASVAGARHLTGLKNALVVDMGGTTTDTAALEDGTVRVCETGSNVGGHKTHVQALEIRTAGFGGDSLIRWEKGLFTIGPRRVAPIAWLGAMYPGWERALEFFDMHLDRYAVSTQNMQVMAQIGSSENLVLTLQEEKILALLKTRPFSIDELVRQTGGLLENSLRLKRLEESFIIQRCGLTLTDILHVTGRFERWDKDAAKRICQHFSRLTKMNIPDMAEHLMDMGIERLTLELLKRQLDEETDPEDLHTCRVCKTLVKNLLSGGNDQYTVRIDLKRPVTGIGAPIHFFLPKAAAVLGAKAELPEDADVANAIGAITSDIVIRRHVRIIPNQEGGFLIEGLAGARHFNKFDAADAFAKDELSGIVRGLARVAGTSTRTVQLKTEDKIWTTADGMQIFIGRTIHAKLTGLPDLVVKEKSHTTADTFN